MSALPDAYPEMPERALDQRQPWVSALVSSGALTLFFVSCLSSGNFIFHVVMSRELGVYGALGSLLGVVTVATFVAIALQAAVTWALAHPTGPREPLVLRPHLCPRWEPLRVGTSLPDVTGGHLQMHSAFGSSVVSTDGADD